MNFLLIIFFTCAVFDGILDLNVVECHKLRNAKHKSINKYKVDLNLMNRYYGLPSKKSGRRLQNWRKGDKVNPEELGDYAEGDILFSVAPKNGLASGSSQWSGNTIPYVISGWSFNADDREMIQSAIDDFHKHTCIRFVPRTNERVYIRITSKSSGCYSSVGYTGYSYDVNLQTPGCTSLKGTVLHELMHAVGFVHEHSRLERDDYIKIFWKNIKWGESFNFDKYPRYYLNDFGVPYDYKSIMHYSEYTFSRNGERTMAPKLNSNIMLGQRDGFSEGDILKINRMYQCSEADTESKYSVQSRQLTTYRKPKYTKRPEPVTERPRTNYLSYCWGPFCVRVRKSYYYDYK